MFDDALEIVIVGLTAAGQPFRPSDWAERAVCGMLSIFGEDRHLTYSPYLKPVLVAGVRCVVVDRGLERLDPAAYAFLLGFARDNELADALRAQAAPAGAGGGRAAVSALNGGHCLDGG